MQQNSYQLHQKFMELGKLYSELSPDEKRRFNHLNTSGTTDISFVDNFIDESLNRNDNMLLG